MRIYVITNALNGKQYVGATIRPLESRLYSHAHSTVSHLSKEIRAVGVKHFSIKLLEEIEGNADVDNREGYWIERLSTLIPQGYNVQMMNGLWRNWGHPPRRKAAVS